jgi:hypothetical protein
MLSIGGAGGRTLVGVGELAEALGLPEQDAGELLERLAGLGLVWLVRGSRGHGGRGGLTPMAAVLSDAGRAALEVGGGR